MASQSSVDGTVGCLKFGAKPFEHSGTDLCVGTGAALLSVYRAWGGSARSPGQPVSRFNRICPAPYPQLRPPPTPHPPTPAVPSSQWVPHLSDPCHCRASASRFRWACRVRPVACICIFLRRGVLDACSESSGRLGRLGCEWEVFAQSSLGQRPRGFHVDSGNECLVRYIYF